MANFKRVTDYSLVLNDQTPIVPQWLRKFPNSVFFQPGPVENHFYIQDVPSRIENPTGHENARAQIDLFYDGGESFVNLLNGILKSDEQLFVKLLIDGETVEGKGNVVGAMLFRYIGDNLISPLGSWGDVPEVEAAITVIKNSMIASGLVADNPQAQPKRVPINWSIERPPHMDFRS